MYSFEELSDSSAALLSQRHSEMRDVGKEIGKLLSSSNRILKVLWDFGGVLRLLQLRTPTQLTTALC